MPIRAQAGPPTPVADQLANEVRINFPGTEVTIGKPGMKVRVYPVPYRELRKFTKHISDAIRQLQSGITIVKRADGTVDPKTLKVLLPASVEVIIDNLLELVSTCCQPSIEEVPHYALPPILEAWLDENFGTEERIRPWVQAIETLLLKLTGERYPIWETFSNVLSPAAIREQMSSSLAGLMPGTSPDPSPGGASASSGTGVNEPLGTSSNDAAT
jgi:hypothetical protein